MQVNGDEGAVFENLVANALLKDIYFRKDTAAFSGSLMYLKNKEKKEVDFLLTDNDGKPEKMVEVKLSDKQLSSNLSYFGEKYSIKGVQVVKNLDRGQKHGELFEAREAKDFLGGLEG